ncbi:uncharacterized protein LOC130762701 isoform X2 [Actinidia eriantha]|nr:uncharacterized protein LOC130762701 isoform X2 [Actinidia eriantha]XP_057474475.1 uncharacterized protein LOC130762701 isoform X2 [Actinidia eriantha]XP_057474476.1 uncharacterized protein LOC130762701 isoform X2 [Actinidia eriantha]XP_057474477.1 uncharacterized protein LOC130762701 isoform X2 [Actinidia eriantha]
MDHDIECFFIIIRVKTRDVRQISIICIGIGGFGKIKSCLNFSCRKYEKFQNAHDIAPMDHDSEWFFIVIQVRTRDIRQISILFVGIGGFGKINLFLNSASGSMSLQARVLLLVLVVAVLLRHIHRGRVLSLVVAAVGVFCHVLHGRALLLVIPALVLRHILQCRRLSIGGDSGSGSCSAFVPVLSEVVVVVGQVYLLLLYPLKVVSGKIFSEKLALLEFKNSVSDPFRPDGLNHCSGSGVRCSLDSRTVTIKIDGDGRDEDEGAYQK